MQALKDRTEGLVLLTATPMQVHPIEVWDLLNLLGLPREWTAEKFLKFFDDSDSNSRTRPHEDFELLAAMFRAAQDHYGAVTVEAVKRSRAAPPTWPRRGCSTR